MNKRSFYAALEHMVSRSKCFILPKEYVPQMRGGVDLSKLHSLKCLLNPEVFNDFFVNSDLFSGANCDKPLNNWVFLCLICSDDANRYLRSQYQSYVSAIARSIADRPLFPVIVFPQDQLMLGSGILDEYPSFPGEKASFLDDESSLFKKQLPITLISLSSPPLPVVPANFCGCCWTTACFSLPLFGSRPQSNLIFSSFLNLCPTLIVEELSTSKKAASQSEKLKTIAVCIGKHISNLSQWAKKKTPMNEEEAQFYVRAQCEALNGLEYLLGPSRSANAKLSEVLEAFRSGLGEEQWVLSEDHRSLLTAKEIVLCRWDEEVEEAKVYGIVLPPYLRRFHDTLKRIGFKTPKELENGMMTRYFPFEKRIPRPDPDEFLLKAVRQTRNNPALIGMAQVVDPQSGAVLWSVHKSILGGHSELWRKRFECEYEAFCSTHGEDDQTEVCPVSVVKVPEGTDGSVVKDLMDFIYDGVVPCYEPMDQANWDRSQSLIELADMYQLPYLQEQIEMQMARSFPKYAGPNNLCPLLVFADVVHARHLRQMCIDVLARMKQTGEVDIRSLESYDKLDQELKDEIDKGPKEYEED